MTREEIVTALMCCVSYDDSDCKLCPLLTNTECLIALKTAAVDLIEKLGADRKDLINEICQYCGKYKQAHEGACDGCKWREM